MPRSRSDSELDDVWSSESGELDTSGELTEFEYRQPQRKQPPAPPKAPPPVTSDLEVPALGAPVPTATLSVGSVLLGSSSESLIKDSRTILADVEKAAIEHVVARSVQTGVADVAIPKVLAEGEVDKVLKGRPSEEPDTVPPVTVPPVASPVENAIEAPHEERLELAFDPRGPSHARSAPPRPYREVPIESGFSMKWIVLTLIVIVVGALVFRML